MSIQSLESEREAILQRMHMSRNGYRHMLMEDSGADHDKPATHFAEEAYLGPDAVMERQRPRGRFPRSMTMRLITRHPVACALAAATLAVLGPRRIMRIATRGSTKATRLALRNRDNIQLLGRVATVAMPMAAKYLQQKRASRR